MNLKKDAAEREEKYRRFTGAKEVYFYSDNVSSKPTAVLSIDRGPHRRSLPYH